MRHKFESFEKFKLFKNGVQNQLGKNIKTLRSDIGGEYLSQNFDDHLRNCGIVSQLTSPGTPQWNGVSKRRNRTLLDMVRSMMSRTDLPIFLWGYALEIVAFLLNRIPSKAIEKTPYELWTGKRFGLFFLKIWGFEAYVKRQAFDKLASKSDKCLFVGYPKETKGYYFYIPSENKVFVARNGVFLEREFISKRVSGSKTSLEEVKELEVATEPSMEILQDSQPVFQLTSSAQGARMSSRFHHEPKRYGFLVTDGKTIELVDIDEPTTFHEAMISPDSEKWLQAMKSEMQSMYDN